MKPKYDRAFYPMIEALRDFELRVAREPKENRSFVGIVAERNGGYNYIYTYNALRDGVDDEWNYRIAERLVKTVLWVCGGYRVGIFGSEYLFRRLKEAYSPEGARAFDAAFMSHVYEQPFEVYAIEGVLPSPHTASLKVGGYFGGYRIGFDAGGSDRKVSAVANGEVVYSEEVVWSPKTEEDPRYHYGEILGAMRTAAARLPRVDAIGVSSAGIYIDNKIMEASLFLKVDKSRYGDYVKNMYLNVAKEIGAPVEVANDGDVTALAGSMELNDGRVLGIAMGTSEAAGYINAEGGLNGWLSELAFAPVDFSPYAVRDSWSGDKGVGSGYFSQDGVIKLALAAGMRLEGATPAEKLKEVQRRAERGDGAALAVFDDIGIYLAYTLPYYAKFYDFKHVLLLGRVTSGRGGDRILQACKRTLAAEFPEMTVDLRMPDEKNRRVGQSIAAASLCPAEAEGGRP